MCPRLTGHCVFMFTRAKIVVLHHSHMPASPDPAFRRVLRGEALRREDLWGEDLRREDLRRADLQGEDLQREDIPREDIPREDLRREDLRKEDLVGFEPVTLSSRG